MIPVCSLLQAGRRTFYFQNLKQMRRKSSLEQWHDRLDNSSVPMRKLNRDGKPIGFASCCLGDYRGQRIVLSVAHQALSDKARNSEPGDWAILSRHDSAKGDFYWFPTE